MSNLEKFIRKNRGEFDNAAPSGKVWDNIEKKIPVIKTARLNDFDHPEKETRRFTIRDIYKWSAVAAIFFIAMTSVYFLFIRKYPDSHRDESLTEKTGSPTKPDDVNSIAPEYAVEFNKVYQSVVTRQKELQAAGSNQPGLYRQFLQDISVLDSSYSMLKIQAAQTPNRDVIIKAMINNLQLQAELLNRQLMIFNEFKNKKTLKNETSSKDYHINSLTVCGFTTLCTG